MSCPLGQCQLGQYQLGTTNRHYQMVPHRRIIDFLDSSGGFYAIRLCGSNCLVPVGAGSISPIWGGGCQPVDSTNRLKLSVGELTACFAKSVLLYISGHSREYRPRASGGDGYRNQPGAWCNDSRGSGHAAFLSRAGEQPGAQHRYLYDIGHLLFVRRERPPSGRS